MCFLFCSISEVCQVKGGTRQPARLAAPLELPPLPSSLLLLAAIILALHLRPNLLRPLLRSSAVHRSSPSFVAHFHSTSLRMSSAPANPWAEPLPKPVEELNTYLAVLPDFTEGSKR